MSLILEKFTAARVLIAVVGAIALWQTTEFRNRKDARERDFALDVGELVRIENASKSDESFLLLNARGPLGVAVDARAAKTRIVTTKGSFVVRADVSALIGSSVSLREWDGRQIGTFLCIEAECYSMPGVNLKSLATQNIESD